MLVDVGQPNKLCTYVYIKKANRKRLYFVAFASFYGENTPTMAIFKLPILYHQMLRWKKICKIGSCVQVPDGTSTPRVLILIVEMKTQRE